MSRIVAAEAWLCDVHVETVRTDAVQSFVKQETIFVRLRTDDGCTGTGYSYTIGTGGRAVLSLLHTHLLGVVVGMDATEVEAIWQAMFASTRATTVGPLTSLAFAAIDTALWDLRCLLAGQPLWRLAGGHRRQMPLYDTDGGWMHLGVDDLRSNAAHAVERGWFGMKIKVGKERLDEDIERARAVCESAGPLHIMADANQSMTYSEAKRRARAFEDLGIYWLEEPLPADDIAGHARLAQSTLVPIAVGESLYSVAQFRAYLEAGAVGIVQADVARVGGITPWLKIAHLAEAFNVKIAPHFLMELHVSLACAVPNALCVEHIPQLRTLMSDPIVIQGGHAIPSDEPGLGIRWDWNAIARSTVAP